ncbi:hypothetical protein N7I30_14035 [Aurantimonas litoralis]|nr:hypothetical protein [Aurantimonas litoralis]
MSDMENRRFVIVKGDAAITALEAPSAEAAIYAEGQVAIEHATAGAGWTYTDGELSPPPVPLDERKTMMASAVNAKRDAIIVAGYRHNFGGSAGIRTLDTRSDSDRVQWLALREIWRGMSETDRVEVIDQSNAVFETSAATAATAIYDMGVWHSRVIVHARNLKNAILEASDADALDEIDTEAGWHD